MDIRSLQCFRLSYESGSIGKAANRAYLTRQGLSQVLKGLEAELRQDLFIRNPQGLEPTELAMRLYPKVVELLNTYDEVQRICFPAEAPKETVRLCVAYGALLSLPFDDLINGFSEAHPEVQLEIDTIEPTLAQRCVAEGKEDIALIAGVVESPDTYCVSLGCVSLYAAVHESLLPAKAERTASDLKGLTWFGLAEDFSPDRALMGLSRGLNLDLAMSFDWHDYHLILDQVTHRKGACFIPEHRIPQFCTNGIVAIPLEGPNFSWEISAVLPRTRSLARSTQIVLDWLRQSAAIFTSGTTPSTP